MSGSGVDGVVTVGDEGVGTERRSCCKIIDNCMITDILYCMTSFVKKYIMIKEKKKRHNRLTKTLYYYIIRV